ncbi:MAG TPA: T9SS type A sorting domain-containing protein, partial [Saprospiraceae bacterium]|nr:T9SS type A sorting domain-containing protein [Saprospiraceae bacterium]
PANDILHIAAEEVISEVQILDPLGRILHKESPLSASSAILMERFPGGIYLVQVSLQQGGQRVYRAVKD